MSSTGWEGRKFDVAVGVGVGVLRQVAPLGRSVVDDDAADAHSVWRARVERAAAAAQIGEGGSKRRRGLGFGFKHDVAAPVGTALGRSCRLRVGDVLG
jgi:hypothetical protein